MDINIAFGADASQSATTLRRWLMADPELRGHATVTVRPRQSLEGQMGQGLASNFRDGLPTESADRSCVRC
ncbi:hypothetical protein [Streptomyces sp. NPDC006925]|uniref:effector-associated constant component EACC1 n=1 Tax=Streptomyces sp. NPDC006925 TaxID=3364768 RepID=UPI0036A6C5B5